MRRLLFLGFMLAMFLLQDYNLQGQSYIMTPEQTITTCSGTFYDPGGPNDNYSDNMSVVQTFVSSDTNSCLQVTFSSIELESSFDRLTIFDGTSAIGAPLATLSGSDSNITITSFSGALTFKFSSDASVQKAGWTAYFSCTTCSDPPPPINICDSIEFHAFCVDENPYGVTFESGTSGNGSLLLGTSKYSCLYSSPNPAWYYMQISSPGDLLIYIEQVSDSGSGLDVDFVCWGPFAASSQNDFVDKLCHGDYFLDDITHGSHRPQNGNHENDMGNYPDGNVVDCSYSAQSTEWCFIPDAAVGEWYLLLITNYSGQAGFITFSPVEEYSFASTNCNLLAPISYNAPLCDGDTLVLTCENPLSGATYNWSGPNGWTAVTTVPSVSIPNVSTYQSGEYTLQITNSDTSVVPSHVDIWIQAIPQVTVTASSDTICDGNSVFLQAAGASTYQWSPSSATTSSITVTPTATTTYTVTGTASGCSSSATYQIAVVYSNAFDTSAVACESILWNGTYYYADTFLRDTLVNVHGCDSVLTVHLTVHHPEHTAVTVTAIDSYTWTSGNGETYTQSGTYYYSHNDGNGCMQVDTLHLTIHHSSNNEFTDMACESYEWDGIVYTTSGDYTRHYQNIYGADSVVTLHLTVHHGTHNVENGTACESYVWHGTTYSSSGTYTYAYVNADGCASVDTLHLAIHHVDLIEFNSTACEEFEWNGVTYQESGDYTRTFTNVAGCDSVVTMHLTINHPVHTAVTVTAYDSYTWTSGDGQTYTQSGIHYYMHEDGNGCAQVDTLHLIIHYSSSNDFAATACEYYLWDGIVYTTSGDYTRHYQNIYGADSAVTLHLTVHHCTHNVENGTACESYVWHGTTYTSSGTYTYAYVNADGCASVDTLHLAIHHVNIIEFNSTACEEFEWNGVTYQESGDYTRTFTNVAGCDSVVTMHLTINHPVHTAVTVTASDSYTWTSGNGQTYTQSGTYYYSHDDGNGCTQVDTLHLTIHHSSSFDFTFTVCEFCEWDGVVYTTSGDYIRHYQDIYGADSAVTLHLTVRYGTHNVENETACESFVWHGATYTSSGTYTYAYENEQGCPSVDTLHLTLYHPEPTSVTVTAYDSYTWTSGDGHTYTQSGTYYYMHEVGPECVQVDTLHLTIHYSSSNDFGVTACEYYLWDGIVYTTSGDYTREYQNIYGADSVVTLHLIVHQGTHKSETETTCERFEWHDETYMESGTYTYAYENEYGCASMDTLHLTLYHPEPTSITVTTYDSYTWTSGDGHTYTQSGIHYYMHEDDNGCAQVDTLHLTIHYSSSNDFAATACESYEWDGQEYTASGDYTRHYQDIYGADSVVTLHLTVHQGTHKSETETTCERFEWHDETYMESGTYTYAYENEYGCASVDTLHLTILPADFTEFNWTACDEYEWNGVTYHESGDYTQTFTNTVRCDSIVTLHLTINPEVHTKFDTSACEEYIWNDTVYYLSGNYTQTFTNVDGCDSVVTLRLTIFNAANTAINITTYDSYIWVQGTGETYTMSGTYYYMHEDENRCPGVDTLYLTIFYSSAYDISAIACDSYEWDGVVYTASGDYTQSYLDVFGADSVVTLHLLVHNGTHNVESDTACVNFVWHGETYTASGTYTYDYVNAYGCASTDTLHLTIHSADISEFTATACETYSWNGETFTETGDYTRAFTNADGCDSVVTLHLTVHYPTHTAVSIMTNDSYTWTDGNDSTYTVPGTYYYTHEDTNGCTQVDTLHLTLHYSSDYDFAATACESYEWNGQVYTTSGDYTRSYQDIYGADSVVTLHLTVHYGTHNVLIDTACESYAWHGETYTSSGEYTYAYENADGCASMDTLHLTIHSADVSEFTATACETYSWNGETFTETGDYTRAFTNADGCDSVVTLHLTVHYPTHTAVSITANDSYTWTDGNDSTYTVSGTYYYTHEDINGCTQVDTLHLTLHYSSAYEFYATACESYEWDSVVYTTSGDYTRSYLNIYGADSVVTLHLTIHHPMHTSTSVTAYDSYTWINGNDSTYTVSGTYYYAHEDDNGCTQVDTLYLTLHYASAYEFYASACDSYEWDGQVYTASGDYTRSYLDLYGADSVVTLHLLVNYGTHNVETDTACVSYLWHGESYTVSGTYTYDYVNAYGCASTDTLHLTIHSSNLSEFEATACETYCWNGETFTESGDYTRTFTNADGCDSVVTLHLTVNYPTHTAVSITANDSYTWTNGNNSTYTVPGTYYYTHEDTHGCTQVDTLYLTLHYSSANEFHATACEFYEWDSVVYTTSGDYTRSYQNIYGADSVVTLHLTVHYGTHNIERDTVCESYVWHGMTYTSSGSYTYAYENANGCASTDTLHLTVNPSYLEHDTLYLLENQLPYYYAAADTTFPNGAPNAFQFSYTLPAQSGCDSTVIVQTYIYMNYSAQFDTTVCAPDLPLLWHNHTFTAPDTVTDSLFTSHGADSILTYILHVNTLNAEIDNIAHIHCFNQNTGAVAVTIAGGTPPMSYLWTNDAGENVSTTTHISNQPAGTYTFTVTDGLGCVDTLTVTLNTLHEEMRAGTITGLHTLCFGESLGWVNGTEAFGDDCVYQWQISNDGAYWMTAPAVNNAQNYQYNTQATSDFMLRRAWISDDCGTLYSNILDVSVIDTALRIVSLTHDFCDEMIAELKVETFMSNYTWSTGDQTPTITVTNPGFYTVTATENGCIASAGYLIEACESHLYLPNAITPGQTDGLNDYFCIPEKAKTNISLFEISIFNRWGEQVFYSTDKNFRWNGEFKGKIYHQNVYTYIIRYTDNVGRPYHVTGSISVL